MTAAAAASIAVRLYRACLAACPPAFRREYGEEMVRDFADACADARGGGGRAVWRFSLVMAIELLGTVWTQWMRTGWPAIALVSVLVPLTLAEALAALGRSAAFVIPPGTAQADPIGVLLLATISVLLIATTLALAPWAARPVLRRRRR